MTVTWSNSLEKVGFFGWCVIEIPKIINMLYLCKFFDSLTNKIQSFQKFKHFLHFKVFILGYRLIRKDRNNEKFTKISIWTEIYLVVNNVAGSNCLGNLVCVFWCSDCSNYFFWQMYIKAVRTWKRNYNCLKYLKISGVSGFSFWAIDAIQKDGNEGNLAI